MYTKVTLIIWELVPHWAPEWLRCPSIPLESRVNIVNEVVTLIYSRLDGLLHSLRLEPRLSFFKVDETVGTEEGKPRAQLIKLYE